MDDARAVRGRKRARDLDGIVDDGRDGKPAARNRVRQRSPLHEFHDDEIRAGSLLD